MLNSAIAGWARRLGLLLALTFLVQSRDAYALLLGAPSNAAVSGGTFVNTPPSFAIALANGFSVVGDYSVTASGGQDVVITIDTSLLFSNLPSNYMTTATLDGLFTFTSNPQGSPNTGAYVAQFENDTSVLDGS